MAELIYSLCALTSLLCAFLLLRSYRKSKSRLLLWSGLCFAGLTLNNILLVLDKIVLPMVDLSLCRRIVALLAILALLYGLIYDDDK
jgi:hypothetical protein